MAIIGITGPIGHGKSTLAKAWADLEPSSFLQESGQLVMEVANKLQQSSDFPKDNQLESINIWVANLPDIILEIFGRTSTFDQIMLRADEVAQNPQNYAKLFMYLDAIHANPNLLKQLIDTENKQMYRPILQWLGGYLVQKIDKDIWYGELVKRAQDKIKNGTKLCIIIGLRFPNDALVVKQAGGVVVQVIRPGSGQTDSLDPTETDRNQIEYDIEIINDGNIDQLHQKAKETLEILQTNQQSGTASGS